MKFSAIALGLMLIGGSAFAQKADSPASQAGKTASASGQTPAQSANPSATEKSGNLSELKTQTIKGTLVDAACGGGSSAAANGGKSSGQVAGSIKKAGDAAKGEADRTANAGSSCNISSTSGEFALQTKDGRTLRFDAVGNERVKQELLNRKSWTNASAAGKPIQASVSGTQTGDSLLVVSIH